MENVAVAASVAIGRAEDLDDRFDSEFKEVGARLQSEVVVEDEDADQGGAEVVVEAPQEELQQHRVGLRCLKEQPLQEGLSYQRQTEMRRSRNKTGQSLRPTGKQLPLLKLLPPPLNLLLFLNLPLLKYQPPLLNLLQ